MLAFALIIVGILARLIPHSPNFTPVIALALFGGCCLNKKYAVILPVALMAVADFVLGFHNTMFFTWGSLIVVSLMGLGLRSRKSAKSIAVNSLAAAILFFIVTNLGVWFVSGFYPMTWLGLTECFMAAIPFFRNTLISTMLYSAVLFWTFEYLGGKVSTVKVGSLAS